MKPRSVKELMGCVIDRLSEDGIINVYAVFSGLPNVLVIAEDDVYKIMLWKDGISIRITLKKETLEPIAVTLPTAPHMWTA